MTTISVVIPAYNAQRTILKTIESAQQQTHQDLEIIVINDGSSDRTLKILETIKDDRLKVYSYPNGGLPTARNRGIAKSTAEYISFIDADDMWTEDKLESQLQALQEHPEAGAVYSWMVCMVESPQDPEDIGFFPGRKVPYSGNILGELLLENFIGNGSNILARRDAIAAVGGFEPSLKSCEDWDYYLRLAAKYPIVLVPKQQIIYRKTAGTMTSKAKIMEDTGLLVLNKAYETAPSQLQPQKNRSLAIFYSYCGKQYLNYSCDPQNIADAREKFWQAIRLYPQILFWQDTRLLLVKLLFKMLFPANVLNQIIPILKQPFAVKDPRRQI